jgi:hypothetical protein
MTYEYWHPKSGRLHVLTINYRSDEIWDAYIGRHNVSSLLPISEMERIAGFICEHYRRYVR